MGNLGRWVVSATSFAEGLGSLVLDSRGSPFGRIHNANGTTQLSQVVIGCPQRDLDAIGSGYPAQLGMHSLSGQEGRFSLLN
jgi:hypothetical protein